MDDKSSKFLNILTTCGIALFAVACLFYTNSMKKGSIDILFIVLICFQLIIGTMISTLAAVKTYKATHMFIGTLLVIWGTFTVLIRYVLPYTVSQWWPIYGISAGILLFISGIFKYHKLKFGYGFPAVVLIVLCLWYSLFSFNIIKVSFVSFAGRIGLAVMLTSAIFLVVFFLMQQKHKELVVEDDDTGVFLDEDPVLPKNE